MRTGAAASHTGYFHETALYGSDDELLDVVVPFLTGGLDAGEPTVVAFAPRNTELVRRALPHADGLLFIPGGDQYARPASAIHEYRKLMARLVAEGAPQVRIVGDVPTPAAGASWDEWARYEAAVNHAYDDFPIWGLCPYDTRTTPDYVLDEVMRTHPHVATADGGHHANERYVDPAEFLAARGLAERDPIEATAPDVELTAPAPAAARGEVARLAEKAMLPSDATEGLLTATSEVVTNAHLHGRPPVLVRAWSEPGRVVVVVRDAGPGPADPFAGLLPSEHSLRGDGGFGLWLAHQLCDDIALARQPDGFTVRMIARTPGTRPTPAP